MDMTDQQYIVVNEFNKNRCKNQLKVLQPSLTEKTNLKSIGNSA